MNLSGLSSGLKKKLLFWLLGTFGPTVLIILVIYCGIASAFSFSSSVSDIETIDINTCTLEELIDAAKDKNVFTDEMLEDLMLDRTSLKRLLTAVYDYNTEQLTKTLKIQHTKTWKIKVYTLQEVPFTDESGEVQYKLTKVPVIKTKTAKENVRIEMDNTWVRERYPIDWQIVYLLCVFHSFDNNEDVELNETGETIRLTKAFIKQVIQDVSCDCTWNANAVDYNWGIGKILPDEVRYDYGLNIYYKDHSYFVPDSSIYSKGYTYTGYLPISSLKSVRSLTYIDTYPTGSVENRNFTTSYDCSKLFELIETYGNGRTVDSFLAALEELPQGTRIADKLIYSLKQGGYEY